MNVQFEYKLYIYMIFDPKIVQRSNLSQFKWFNIS